MNSKQIRARLALMFGAVVRVYGGTLMLTTACALTMVGTQAHAADQKVNVDVPALIRQASTKYQGQFKLSERQAVAQMDSMLVQQYAAAGRIANEKNAYLKGLYYQASTLLLNGHPIAGGTVVAIARIQPAFSQSPGGRGLAHFVDAMLAGDEEEDADLVEYMARTKRAQAVLRGLRPELQVVAQLRVVGEIYHDEIAVDVGKAGLTALNATAAERKTIEQAIKVK